MSHYRDGVWGAQAVAAAVAVAMVDGSIDEIIDAAMSAIPEESWLYYNMTQAFAMLEKSGGNILDIWMDLHDFLWTSSWATTAEAIPSAFACLRPRTTISGPALPWPQLRSGCRYHRRGGRCDSGRKIRSQGDSRALDRKDTVSLWYLPDLHQRN